MNKPTDIGNKRWYIWIGFIGTVIALIVFITGKNLPDFFGKSQSSKVLVADQVRICMQQHGLSQARAVLKDQSNLDQSSYDSKIFAECEWPPQSYSAADGYSEIRVITVAGPGLSEAEGSTEIDRLIAPCKRLRLSYSFGNQGNFDHLPTFVAAADSIVTPEGVSWNGDIHTLNFYPERNEIIVVRNLSYVLDQVECVQ
jgi:hypothetical protein